MIESAPERGEKQPRRTSVKLPITLEIIPTPPRSILVPLHPIATAFKACHSPLQMLSSLPVRTADLM